MSERFRAGLLLVALGLVVTVAYAEYEFQLVRGFDAGRPLQSLGSLVERVTAQRSPAIASDVNSDTPAQTTPAAVLSLEAKLLRTILIGKPYGIASVAAALSAAGSTTATPLTRELAAAALVATQAPPCCGFQTSETFLRQRLFSQTRLEPVAAPADVPRINNDDMVLIHAYAMVSGGQAEAAVTLLKDAIAEASPYSQSVAVVALRAIGTASAHAVLQAPPTTDKKVLALAEEARGIKRPSFAEPKSYESEMPIAQRDRVAMLQQANNDQNGTRTIMPTLLLGYVGDDAPATQREQELAYLRSLPGRYDERIWYRYWYGTVSLSLRSRESHRYWQARLASEPALYTKMAIIRIMAQADPRAFAASAPDIVASPGMGWVRSEAVILASAIAQGHQPIGSLDLIWFPPRRYRINYPAHPDALPVGDSDAIMRRFATGNFAIDPECRGCVLPWLHLARRLENDALYLLGLIRRGDPNRAYAGSWQPFTDRRVLPALHALAKSLPEGSDARTTISNAARELEAGRGKSAETFCCEQTDACLVSQAHASLVPKRELQNLAEAVAYLEALPERPPVQIRYEGELRREAMVTIGKQSPQRWTHWLGCWRPE